MQRFGWILLLAACCFFLNLFLFFPSLWQIFFLALGFKVSWISTCLVNYFRFSSIVLQECKRSVDGNHNGGLHKSCWSKPFSPRVVAVFFSVFFPCDRLWCSCGWGFCWSFLFCFLVWFGFFLCFFVSVFVFFIKNVFRSFGLSAASEGWSS
jgi:hypothetical protein